MLFRSKTILQRDISVDEVKALLEEGKTPLLDGFVSKRTGRAFKAFLVYDEKKGTIFKFEERKPKEKAAKADAAGEKAEKAEKAEAPKRTTRRRTTAKTSS